MQPPSRMTRSTNNPGVVDLPKSRRPSSEVSAEKLKKKETAAANAKKKHEQAAQVARVEREIKAAQKEGTLSSRRVSRVKKTFSRESAEDRVNEVSHFPAVTPRPLRLTLNPFQAAEPALDVTVSRIPRLVMKRKVSSMVDDDLDHNESTKAAKYVPTIPPFFEKADNFTGQLTLQKSPQALALRILANHAA